MNTENTRKILETVTTAYFDRSNDSTEGVFTVQTTSFYDDGQNSILVVGKLPARSGQRGYTHTSWVRGKSPVPYGDHLLWLKPQNLGLDVEKDPRGMGAFYFISNTPDNKRLIKDPFSPYERFDIGLHEENDKPGSAGCIVLLNRTKEEKTNIYNLYKYFQDLSGSKEYIRLRVL